jgi:hypothetical protein
MKAGGQPHASRFTPMGRSSPPVQLNKMLTEPMIQSGYLRGEKILVPLRGCFLDTRSEMLCNQKVYGDVRISPLLCVYIGCSSARKFARLNSSAAEWISKNFGREIYDSGSHRVQDKTTIRNVGNYLPQETVWHPRRIESLATLLWEFQIMHSYFCLPTFLYKDQWKFVSVILVVSRDWSSFSELRRRCNSELGRRSWSTEDPEGVYEGIALSARTRVYAHVVSGKDSRDVLKH